METKQLIHTLVIPTFGKCTLLSVDSLPDKMHTYNNIWESAKVLGLTEIGETSHGELQELMHALACYIKHDSSVWISGAIKAYAEIHPHRKNQKMRDCVVGLILSKPWESRYPLEPWFEYVPVDQVRESSRNDTAFCLFRGEV